MTRYDFMTQEYQKLATQQGDFLRIRQLEQQLASVSGALERNPFVMVLIDGDGMIFENEFLRKGIAGGKQAAATLYSSIVTYIERETTIIPTTSRVLCRIYANVKGLADVLVRAGIVEDADQFEGFVRGFTNGRTLFDFIDVGPGKDRADDKIIGEAASVSYISSNPTDSDLRNLETVCRRLPLPSDLFRLLA